MKQLFIISNSLLLAFVLSNCGSSSAEVTPSKNAALNSISKSNAGTKKEGAMQKSLNTWLHDDWEPTISKDKEIQKKYMEEKKEVRTKTSVKETQESHFVDKEDKNFTLQEYVDKAGAYMRAKPNDYNSSHVKKVESLPVIGK